jgi:hypothetical protein
MKLIPFRNGNEPSLPWFIDRCLNTLFRILLTISHFALLLLLQFELNNRILRQCIAIKNVFGQKFLKNDE